MRILFVILALVFSINSFAEDIEIGAVKAFERRVKLTKADLDGLEFQQDVSAIYLDLKKGALVSGEIWLENDSKTLLEKAVKVSCISKETGANIEVLVRVKVSLRGSGFDVFAFKWLPEDNNWDDNCRDVEYGWSIEFAKAAMEAAKLVFGENGIDVSYKLLKIVENK